MFFNWRYFPEPKLCRHKFEGRWDEEPRSKWIEGAWGQHGFQKHGASKRIYIRDICVKCGKTIERAGE